MVEQLGIVVSAPAPESTPTRRPTAIGNMVMLEVIFWASTYPGMDPSVERRLVPIAFQVEAHSEHYCGT